MNIPKRAVCANCHNKYVENDKFCRFCGAPMGTPFFIEEKIACIYGPMPIKRKHTCEKCGFVWETHSMVDRAAWCPQCGGSAPAVEVNMRPPNRRGDG